MRVSRQLVKTLKPEASEVLCHPYLPIHHHHFHLQYRELLWCVTVRMRVRVRVRVRGRHPQEEMTCKRSQLSPPPMLVAMATCLGSPSTAVWPPPPSPPPLSLPPPTLSSLRAPFSHQSTPAMKLSRAVQTCIETSRHLPPQLQPGLVRPHPLGVARPHPLCLEAAKQRPMYLSTVFHCSHCCPMCTYTHNHQATLTAILHSLMVGTRHTLWEGLPLLEGGKGGRRWMEGVRGDCSRG